MNKLFKIFWGLLIISLLFPIYSLLAVDEIFSNEWSDVLIGNVILGLVLICGGYKLYPCICNDGCIPMYIGNIGSLYLGWR